MKRTDHTHTHTHTHREREIQTDTQSHPSTLSAVPTANKKVIIKLHHHTITDHNLEALEKKLKKG